MISTRKVADQLDATKEAFESNLQAAIGNPTLALEFLRQMCLCSRTRLGNESLLNQKLLIIVEGADLIIPEGDITALFRRGPPSRQHCTTGSPIPVSSTARIPRCC